MVQLGVTELYSTDRRPYVWGLQPPSLVLVTARYKGGHMRYQTTFHTIAILGAGASGTLVAAQLLQHTSYPLHLLLIEPRPLPGRGVAYSTTDAHHLLNVPAKNMSAYVDAPDHFLQWLASQGTPVDECAFVSRQRYGRYLEFVLAESARKNGKSTLEYICDEALALERDAHGALITLKSGRQLYADQVVLALGNLAPRAPAVTTPAFYQSKRYRGNPWQAELLADIPPDASVLLLGTGLTMIDVAVTLKTRGHTGKITAISRHGLLPEAHKPQLTCPPVQMSFHAYPLTTRGLLHKIRQACEEVKFQQMDWRCIIDALRPDIQAIWQALSLEERRRFLRHVQTHWEVRRHRIAPAIATMIEEMRAAGQLQVYAGRVQSYYETNRKVTAAVRIRQATKNTVLQTQYVINCTGPCNNIEQAEQPLLQGLYARGMIRPDALHLGLEATAEGAVVARDGKASSLLYTLGPLQKGILWETTAVPEIRLQARRLALHLIQQRAPAASSSVVPH